MSIGAQHGDGGGARRGADGVLRERVTGVEPPEQERRAAGATPQDWIEAQHAVVQDAAERFGAVGSLMLRAMRQATEDAWALLGFAGGLTGGPARNGAGAHLKELHGEAARLTQALVRSGLDAAQDLARLADPSPFVAVQVKFASECLGAMLDGTAMVARATRRATEDELRSFEAGLDQRRRARAGDQPAQPSDAPRDGTVADVMTAQVRTVAPGDTVQYAAGLMREHGLGALPVSDDGGKLVGMVTDRDVALRLVAEGRDPARTLVRDVMTPGVRGVFEDEAIGRAAANMAEQNVNRLPVLDREERLVGVLSLGDLALNGNQRWLAGRALDDAEHEAEREAPAEAAE